MNEHSPGRGSGVKRRIHFVLAIALLVLAYQGVIWGVRSYTSGLIRGVEGRQLPEFALADLDGHVVTDTSLRGKSLVLNFFRSNCHGCRAEKEGIKELVREVDPERVAVIGIMVDRVQGYPADVTARTLAEFGYTHPILMADQAFVDAFHGAQWAQITPITYVVDAKGRIVKSFRHPYSLDDLRAAIP